MGCRTNEVSEESGEIPSCLVQPTGESPDMESERYSKDQYLLHLKYHDIYMHYSISQHI